MEGAPPKVGALLMEGFFYAATILALFWLYFASIWLYFGAHKQGGADLHFGFILGLTNKPGLTFILASIWG